MRDLARTEQEPLLKKVRKILRAQYGFPRGEKNKYHIDAVFSTEPLRYPDSGDALRWIRMTDASGADRPQLRRLRFGMVVTATFGMVAAGHVLRKLAQQAR